MRATNERFFFSKEIIVNSLIYNWHKVEQISFAAMQSDQLIEITVADKRIVLVKRNNIIYAFTALCPHAGARLCDGWLDVQCRIVCPDHKYRFDPVNGRNTSGEGYKLFTYPVEIKVDEIFIGLLNTLTP